MNPFCNMPNMPMMQNQMMQNQMMQNQMFQNQMMQNQMMQNQMMQNQMMQNQMMQNQMMQNKMMMYQNMQKMNQTMNQQMQNPAFKRISRIKKEYELCSQDGDLIQIGCSFGLVNQDNYNVWKVSMVGPQNTPYAGGVFIINVYFPDNYPKSGAEFRFVNKIYHLNVDFENEESKGHICLSSLNEWRTTGKVANKPVYGIKQALFDIFCLFYNQGIDSPYDPKIAEEYRDRRKEFDAKAKLWTEKYAK